MRLNVYLQTAGIGSRREAERMVEQGRVSINGEMALATTPVDDGDVVKLDGSVIAPATRSLPRLFLLHKPIDILVTNNDPQGRPTIFEMPVLQPPLWGADKPRVMNVGRLDVNSEGLLVMSSDGPLAQTMMSPATALPRVYRVRCRGKLSPAERDKLAKGLVIDDMRYRGAEVVEETEHSGRSNTWYRVTLREGKNREIRKLFEYFGNVVNRLIRIQYGPFHLGELPAGEIKEVPANAVKRFMEELAQIKPGAL